MHICGKITRSNCCRSCCRVTPCPWQGPARSSLSLLPFPCLDATLTPWYSARASLLAHPADPSKGTAPGVVKESADRELVGKLELLRGVSFHAQPARVLALLGGSGAGKTTLFVSCGVWRDSMWVWPGCR